jgi:ABC-2 type transport system ATP-binding protein
MELADLPSVNALIKVADKWRLYTEDPAALLPYIIQYAESNHLRVVSLNTLGPSLEDVFLEITGGQIGAVTSESQENQPKRKGMGGRK